MSGAAKKSLVTTKPVESKNKRKKFLTDTSSSSDDESQKDPTMNRNGSNGNNEIFSENTSTQDRRNFILDSNLFIIEKEMLFNKLQPYFKRLEARSKSNTKNKISAGTILSSSCVSKSLPHTIIQYTSSMSLFCSYWTTPNDLDIITDARSTDIYTVPLWMILMKEDRKFITDLSKQKSCKQNQDGYVHPERYYCSFVSSISQPRNKFMRNILSQFFNRYFDDNSTQIMKEDLKMKQKNMQAIIIFDRVSSNIPKLSNPNSIVSAIVFSFETKKAVIYIDYVATHEHYVRGSFATMLINLVQHCCLVNYQKLNVDVSNVTTCLNCIKPLAIVYARYGFKMNNLEEISVESDTYHCVYEHFDGGSWYNAEKDLNHQCMAIMFHNGIVPRWVNYLNYELKEAEVNLFSVNMVNDGDNQIQFENSFGETNVSGNAKSHTRNIMRTRQNTQSSFVSTDPNTQLSQGISYAVNAEYSEYLSQLANELKYQEITEYHITLYQSSTSLSNYISNIRHGPCGYIQLGDIYTETYEGYKNNETMFPEKHTLLTKEVMRELTIRLIPNKSCYIDNNDYSYGIWFELKCRKCHKSCFVKKRAGMHCDEFLIKAIYSKWTTHVFGLELEETDIWNQCNVGWNICKARTKGYYHKLKHAIVYDTSKPLTVFTQIQSYISQRNHHKILCGLLFGFHKNLVLSAFAFGIDIREYLKLNRRRSNLTYTEREKLIVRDIGVTKSLVKSSKRAKIQTKADIKKRHAEEKEWGKTYYADLTLQKNIVKLGFFKPNDISYDKLWPDSKDYVTFYRSDKYLKSKNKDLTINADLSHFVALTADKKKSRDSQWKDYVISEDYFLEKNMFGKTTGKERISSATIAKCYKEPNKLHPLTKADKRLIEKHVNKLLSVGEIQKIRLMPEKDHKVETLLYNGKRHESKIRFEGIDSSNHVHQLSDDWMEINFGQQKDNFLDRVMTLTYSGTYVDIPIGNRNLDSTKWPLKIKDKGPLIKYKQEHNNSCIFCSVASAFHELGERMISQKIMSVYMSRSILKNFVPSFHELFDIL